MASAVDLVNTALSHIGDTAKVSAISPPDASIQALHAARFYPIARDLALSRHAWQFATKRALLAELTVDEDMYGEFAYAYALPALCIRVLNMVSPTGLDLSMDEATFAIEVKDDGTQILLTNVPPGDARVRYIAGITDTGKFSPPFALYLTYELAALLAGPIRKNEKTAAAMRQMAREFLIVAAGQDSNAQNQDAAKRKAYTPASIRARGFSSPSIPDAWVDRS